MVAMADLPAPTSRVRSGRWLGGVCAGLAARWDLPVSRLRGAFVLAALFAGLGVVVYAACWLILPTEGENGAAAGQRGIVLLAQACGTLLGLGTLGVLGAVATIFGFGWIVVALAGAVLVGTLAGWARLGPAWALLPIGALVLPSVALAVGGVRIEPSTTSVVLTPRALSDLPPEGLRSGLGTLEVDLRHTQLPSSGTIALQIDAGVRRTLVALPHDRCVHVEVLRESVPLALRAGSALLGRTNPSTPEAIIFGDWPYGSQKSGTYSKRTGPTLRLEFASAGGELVVRDYPDDVDPGSNPDWPGYQVWLEERPDTTGTPKKAARLLVDEWRERRKIQLRSQKRIDRLMGGPCVVKKETER
jgi:phage shock protein PspC (stress-responsive transcriptional regulator)